MRYGFKDLANTYRVSIGGKEEIVGIVKVKKGDDKDFLWLARLDGSKCKEFNTEVEENVYCYPVWSNEIEMTLIE